MKLRKKEIKKTVTDDLHDGGDHYPCLGKVLTDGSTVIYVKFTHEGNNPNTKLPNIPIDKYLNDGNPGSRGKFLALIRTHMWIILYN